MGILNEKVFPLVSVHKIVYVAAEQCNLGMKKCHQIQHCSNSANMDIMSVQIIRRFVLEQDVSIKFRKKKHRAYL